MATAWPDWALRILATWRAVPERQQWLLVGTALFVAVSATLYFTRLGNRRLALKSLAVAAVLHALAWGYAREYHELTVGREAVEKVPAPERFSVLLAPRVPETERDEATEELRAAERGALPEPEADALARREEEEQAPQPTRALEPEPVAAKPLPVAEDPNAEAKPAIEPLAPAPAPEPALAALPGPAEAPEMAPVQVAPLESPPEEEATGPVVARRRPARGPLAPARPLTPANPGAEVREIVPDTRPPRHSEDSEPDAPIARPGLSPPGPLQSIAAAPAASAPSATEAFAEAKPAESPARDAPDELGAEPPLLARRAGIKRLPQPSLRPEPAGESEVARPAGPTEVDRDIPAGAANDGPVGGLGAVAAIWRNRTAPDRREIVERFGGSVRTEQAVASALEWLALHQSAEGYWDSDGFFDRCPAGDRCEGPAIEGGSDAGLTGLALLAFLGAGHTHLESEQYREVVRKGLSWLLSMQKPDGDLRYRGRIYCHSMATLSLTEAFAMSGDERLKEPAQRAIDWLAAAQHPQSGGWRYGPGQFGDTSVYGWAILALRSARNSGLEVPTTTWERSRQWLNLVSLGARGGLACYRPGSPPTHAMTAEALVCRQVFGLERGDPRMDEAGDYLLARPPDPSDYHLYYWYYGTLAMFQLGGDHWLRWNDRLARTLLATQNTAGHRRGSWDPQRPFGVDGGRVFATACSALCLEVYYRYLPLYTQSGLGSADSEPRKRPRDAAP